MKPAYYEYLPVEFDNNNKVPKTHNTPMSSSMSKYNRHHSNRASNGRQTNTSTYSHGTHLNVQEQDGISSDDEKMHSVSVFDRSRSK